MAALKEELFALETERLQHRIAELRQLGQLRDRHALQVGAHAADAVADALVDHRVLLGQLHAEHAQPGAHGADSLDQLALVLDDARLQVKGGAALDAAPPS